MSINGKISRRTVLRYGVSASLSGGIVGNYLHSQAWAGLSAEQLTLTNANPRVVLGDGHLLLALALILDDPISVLAGWQGDLIRHSSTLYNAYLSSNPSLAKVPVLGGASSQTFSVEAALALEPDALILGGGYGPGPNDTDVIKKFEAAGIPIVFVDFHQNAFNNTAPSIRKLGTLFGGEAAKRAKSYADLHENRMEEIQKQVMSISNPRPRVLLESNAGMSGWGCCWIPGGNGLGRFIEAAGGQNIGLDIAPQRAWVKADREFVLTSKPDIYITTGGPYLKGTSGLLIGPGISKEDARTTLAIAATASKTGMASSLAQDNIHGLWHLFHATPLNILVMEALAQWLHPSELKTTDRTISLDKINRDFLSLPIDGCLSVSL